MVSKRPQEKGHHEIGVQYGTFDWKQIQADTTGKLTGDGQWLYRVIGIFRDADIRPILSRTIGRCSMPAITWQPTKDTNWTVIGLYQKDKDRLIERLSCRFMGRSFPIPTARIPSNRFTRASRASIFIQTTTKSVTSLFEHSFSDNLKGWAANMRYAHSRGRHLPRRCIRNSYTNYLGYLGPPARRISPFIWIRGAAETVTQDRLCS